MKISKLQNKILTIGQFFWSKKINNLNRKLIKATLVMCKFFLKIAKIKPIC